MALAHKPNFAGAAVRGLAALVAAQTAASALRLAGFAFRLSNLLSPRYSGLPWLRRRVKQSSRALGYCG